MIEPTKAERALFSFRGWQPQPKDLAWFHRPSDPKYGVPAKWVPAVIIHWWDTPWRTPPNPEDRFRIKYATTGRVTVVAYQDLYPRRSRGDWEHDVPI